MSKYKTIRCVGVKYNIYFILSFLGQLHGRDSCVCYLIMHLCNQLEFILDKIRKY
jgi:hypothetical protein